MEKDGERQRRPSRRSRQRSEERFSRNAETDLVCRLLLEKKKSFFLQLLDRFGSSRSGPVGRGATRPDDSFPSQSFHVRFHDGAIRFSETRKQRWLQSCQPWSYRRLLAYSFLGSCERA